MGTLKAKGMIGFRSKSITVFLGYLLGGLCLTLSLLVSAVTVLPHQNWIRDTAAIALLGISGLSLIIARFARSSPQNKR